jgi:hypothetical protein
MIYRSKFIVFLFISCYLVFSCSHKHPADLKRLDRIASIYPDYSGIIMPSNIAPLNFKIKEEGVKYQVRFYGENNKGFTITSKQPEIRIPLRKWKNLLKENSNRKIFFDISVMKLDGSWIGFKPVENIISQYTIDSYIVYRHINPALNFWKDMAIVERSLETFDESDLLSNKNTDYNCIHCHTFNRNDPDEMVLHVRDAHPGTIIKTKEKTLWLKTKTPQTISSFAYPDWHPGGRFIAFSVNKIHQFFFGSGHRLNNVYDNASDIVIFDTQKNKVFTSPKIASKDLENLPAWSPDGKYLYYINAPVNENGKQDSLVKYDLMRIHFNENTLEFGEPELLISSKTTGMSISFPEVSPDGNFVLFCMADYGYFTIGNPTSDLYMLDLRSNTFKKLSINSDQTESFHCWSSNGRWIVFASKREDGTITLPYFSYIDTGGIAYKPFVLPMKDPDLLESRLFNFNRPVFVKTKPGVSQEDLLKKILNPTSKVYFDTLFYNIQVVANDAAANENTQGTPYSKRE